MIAIDTTLSQRHIERRLAEHTPKTPLSVGMKRSAVACVLRFKRDSPDVLLMKRAERKNDRWSGQISFPGGREQTDDIDLQATAIRETREEMGVDLTAHAQLLGRLDTIRAIAKGGVRPLTITPYVFIQTDEFHIELNQEAVDWFWLPLAQAAAGELSGVYRYKFGPIPRDLPCWRYDGYLVWGLTYQMLDHLLDVVAR